MRGAEFAVAVARAAELLRGRRLPVVSMAGVDVAGAAAAIRLAEALGGVIDHTGAEGVLRDVSVLRDSGMMLVSPGEAARRADVVLIVGDRPLSDWPEFAERLRGDGAEADRDQFAAAQVLALATSVPPALGGRDVTLMPAASESLPGLLGALRAAVNGRPLADGSDRASIGALAGRMRAARYGVALWSPAELDVLSIELLAGLIKDLNEATRWAGFSVGDDLSAMGACMAAGWMTGAPLRTGFSRGAPEHDPWRFEARRLAESGEADAVVWASVADEAAPDWIGDLPAVIVGGADGPAAAGYPRVSIRVGRPGVDHDGIFPDRLTATLAEQVAAAPRQLASAADALNAIRASLAP